jgi:hypothetical protein
MNTKEKKNDEKTFQEGVFPFPFKKFEKMAEMMKNCCTGEGSMADCCSMMKKMMQCGKEEKSEEKKKETGETE